MARQFGVTEGCLRCGRRRPTSGKTSWWPRSAGCVRGPVHFSWGKSDAMAVGREELPDRVTLTVRERVTQDYLTS